MLEGRASTTESMAKAAGAIAAAGRAPAATLTTVGTKMQEREKNLSKFYT